MKRAHIFLVLLTLIFTACASKEHLTASQQEKLDQRQEVQTMEFSKLENSASRVR